MTLQILLISEEGRRPLSTLISVKDWAEYRANKATYNEKAIAKILTGRHMSVHDARRYGYNTIQVRVYNKERIAQREADRYSQQVRGHIIQ
jgi:hypothetical protein